jgi:hypothetical protein
LRVQRRSRSRARRLVLLPHRLQDRLQRRPRIRLRRRTRHRRLGQPPHRIRRRSIHGGKLWVSNEGATGTRSRLVAWMRLSGPEWHPSVQRVER